jgi:2-aminoadipate transaminase
MPRVSALLRIAKRQSGVNSYHRLSGGNKEFGSSRRLYFPRRADLHNRSSHNTMFNFAKGHPNRKLLPVKEIQEILVQVSLSSNENDLTDSLNYPKRDSGTQKLLQELRAFLGRHTSGDDLGNGESSNGAIETSFFVTHGVSHGLDLLCAAQTQPGDVVLVERPTYFLAAGIFRSHGLEVQSLPMTQNGVDMDRLERELENGSLKPPRMIYIIPTHQNPSATVMSIKDRWRLARLARRHGILVTADEVYHLLDWRVVAQDGPRPARMAVVDSLLGDTDGSSSATLAGCCVTVSSFTKIFAPGVRCGWVEGPPHIVKSLENLGYILSQGGCAPLVGELMHASLKLGIGDRVLAKLNSSFRERSQKLCEILAAGDGIHVHRVPVGGYFIWVSFDGVADTSDFLAFCDERGVRFLPGARCVVTSDSLLKPDESSSSCHRYARFCFADLDLDDIEKGANLVLECYHEFLKCNSATEPC